MGIRRKSRELVLQMLFQADMGKQTPELVRKTFWAERSNVEDDVRGFAEDLFRVASDRMTEIDALIESKVRTEGYGSPCIAVVSPGRTVTSTRRKWLSLKSTL